jgi:hypothetical protein
MLRDAGHESGSSMQIRDIAELIVRE